MNIKKIIILSLFLSLLGCIKEPSDKIEYGPETSVEDIQSTLKSALGSSYSPEFILKNEQVNFIRTREIKGIPKIDILSQVSITVVDRKETKNQWQIYNTEEIKNYDLTNPNQSPPSIVREDHQCWSKESLKREECEVEASMKELTHSIQFKPMSQSNESAIVSYHNLSSKKGIINPPKAVMDSENCAGILHCKIRVTQVEFDQIIWTENREANKVHFKIIISPDVPWFSRHLQVCDQSSIQVKNPDNPDESPRFLVTTCETVENFMPGSL